MAKLNMIMQTTYEPVGASADTSFKTDGRLFASAYNKVKTAKTIINGCKNLLASNSFDSNSDFTKLKDSIMYSGINALVEKIEETKTSLMQMDSELSDDFADAYMRATQEFLMSASDNQNMTEEERMQYNLEMAACQEEYYRNCLYILEKYEESEMLTEEMENELKYLRSLVAQYDIRDKIAGLEPTSEEYINLFKENAEHTRNLIKYNASLSEEDKSKMLGEFEKQYQAQLKELEKAREDKLKVEEYELELQELYQAKADNSDFWHPFVENEIDESILEMKVEIAKLDQYNKYAATADEIAYFEMNGWGKFCENTKTFCASTATGFMSFGEGLMDGAVMLTVGTVGLFNEDVATWTSEFVGISHSDEVYNSWVKSGCLNEVSAYGGWHTAGDTFGQLIGKVGTSFFAPWANAVVSGVQAVGSSSETSFINGEEYGAVFAKGLVSGVGGAFEGYAMSKMNIGVREFAASGALKTIGSAAVTNAKNFGSTLVSKGGIKAAGQSVLNATVNGAKKLPSALGKAGWATLTEADAMVETGCVLVNNIIDSAVTGEWDIKKIVLETGTVFAINYVMNFATTMAFDINTKAAQDAFEAKTNLYKEYNIDDIYQSMAATGYFKAEDLPIDKLKKIFKGNAEIEIEGVKIKVTNEEAIKRAMMSLSQTGLSGGGYTSSQLFNALDLSYDIPAKGSLNILESRVWYLESEKLIPTKLDDYKWKYMMSYGEYPSLRDCAIFCCNERNNLRAIAREAMSDDVLRAYLNATENNDFEFLMGIKRAKLADLNHTSADLITDDMVYQDIINSWDALNKLLGIGVENSGK